MQHQIAPFNTFVLRSSLLPCSFVQEIYDADSMTYVFEQLNNPMIKEAIAMASPELISEAEKLLLISAKQGIQQSQRVGLSLLKYLIRMSSRCTPFGLFAGCASGELDKQTKIELHSPERHKKYSNLDMQFWVALLKKFEQKIEVRKQLIYTPNNSLYRIGSHYRYIEYTTQNNRRTFKISGFEADTLIESVLSFAKEGVTISQLIDGITDSEEEREEAQQYVHELIDNQILVSNLEPTITGKLDTSGILNILDKIPELSEERINLDALTHHLKMYDKHLVGSEHRKPTLLSAKYLYPELEQKYLIQTDLILSASVCKLNQKVTQKLPRVFQFLHSINPERQNANMERFKQKFIERYGEQKIPLALALDAEAGIGYGQNFEGKDSHPFLEKFDFPQKPDSSFHEVWHPFHFQMEKLLKQACIDNLEVIQLKSEDFPYIKTEISLKAPATFSCMVELVKSMGKEKIILLSAGGSSATSLIGRFADSNLKIKNLFQEIIEYEESFYTDELIAEIVHLPEARTGNILRRPNLRKNEIPFLAQESVAKKHTINIADLFVQIHRGKAILWSNQHEREVLPYLSNAHNYSAGSLPLYHFLCDLTEQNNNANFFFSWGVLLSHYNYFPRVEFSDVIVQKAKWKVVKEELRLFENVREPELYKKFTEWRIGRQIPVKVNLVEGDHTLFLNLSKKIGTQLFLQSAKNKNTIWLEEFLFEQDSILSDYVGNPFTNQFVIPFYTRSGTC